MLPRSKPLLFFFLAAAVVGLVVGLGVAWLTVGIGPWGGAPTQEETEKRFRQSAGFDPRETFPSRETNAAAREVESLADELHFDPETFAGADTEAATFAVAGEAVRSYLLGLRVPEPSVGPLPAEAEAYLDHHAARLEKLEATLRGTPAPRWSLELEHPGRDTTPNLLNLLRLHRLLMVKAARSEVAADQAARDQTLEAAWALSESVAADPRLIANLIHLALLRDFSGLLRALESPPAGWADRLAERTPREALRQALHLESWHAVRLMSPGAEGDPCRDRRAGWHCRYLVRHAIADTVGVFDRVSRHLDEANIRDLDVGDFMDREVESLPRWNVFARMLIPNLLDAPLKAARTEVDLELTRRVLEARKALASDFQGDLPGLSGPQSSEAFPDLAWVYELQPDGLTIRAGEDLPAAAESPLPLKVVLARPPAES